MIRLMTDEAALAPNARARERLDWAEKTLHAMLHGDKPSLDTRNPAQAWLYDQMTRMYKAGFLCEEPVSYVTLDDEDPADAELRKFKGVTDREPLPKQLTSQAKNLQHLAHEERRNLHNFKVLGVDPAYRYHRDVLDQTDDADSFVLTKGGIMELYQYVLFLRAQNDGLLDLTGKTFVVLNDEGFWNPTLKALDGMMVAGNNLVTDTRHDTVEALEQVLGGRKTREPDMGSDEEFLPPGSTMFLITGNRKKVLDYKKVFARRGVDAQAVWFHQKFDKPLGADEFSYSYVGNLREKLNNFYEHIRDHYGAAKFRDVLKEKGYELEKSVVWFDDSGLEMQESLTGGPEFNNCSYRMNPVKKHGPGAEMKNAINAMQNHPFDGERGVRGFVKRMQAAAGRILADRVAAGVQNPRISMLAIDRATAATFRLQSMVEAVERGDSFEKFYAGKDIHFLQATTQNRLVFEPQPNDVAVDTKNFLVPLRDPDGRTMADNPHYVAQHSITAQLVKTAARVLGFEHYEHARHLSQTFAKQAGEAWRIGTQHSIHKGSKATGLPQSLVKSMKGLFRLMPGNGGRFDLGNVRDHVLLLEDETEQPMPNALNNFYDFTLKMDGFLLTPDSRTVAGDDYFWHRAFTFFSLIVGRQINDKAVTAKPLMVMDCPTWQPFLRLLEVYGGGLIPEMPGEILDARIKPGDDVLKSLNRSFSSYRPDEVPSYKFREDGDQCPDELFRVTIYCSASTTDYPMKLWARDFAFDCGALGFAVKNGGGTGPDGLMIETSEGVRQAREDFDAFLKVKGKRGAPPTHVSSIQCVDTAQEEGLCKFNDYWAVYPTIYQRMHELQNCDAEVVLPGGAGTLQEIAASVLMRKLGLYPVQNRPLVIVNHNGIFDEFLKIIPAQDFDTFNIKVVNTAQQAMDLLVEARAARKMEPELPYTREEFSALKQSYHRALLRQEQAAKGPAQKLTVG